MKLCNELDMFKKGFKKKLKPQSWINEISVMSARQKLIEQLETEALNMTKVDHPAYFRRRFLKSKTISEEVNELRADEYLQNNKTYIEKEFEKFGQSLIVNGMLDKRMLIQKYNDPSNDFNINFMKDPLNGTSLLIFGKREVTDRAGVSQSAFSKHSPILFSIRLDKTLKIPK